MGDYPEPSTQKAVSPCHLRVTVDLDPQAMPSSRGSEAGLGMAGKGAEDSWFSWSTVTRPGLGSALGAGYRPPSPEPRSKVGAAVALVVTDKKTKAGRGQETCRGRSAGEGPESLDPGPSPLVTAWPFLRGVPALSLAAAWAWLVDVSQTPSSGPHEARLHVAGSSLTELTTIHPQ